MRYQPCTSCSSLQLLKEINRTSRGLRFARQTEPKAYIAAYFKDLPKDFTLGDGKLYGDFENKQLQNGQEYIFFVLAVLEISENVSLYYLFMYTFNHRHKPKLILTL